MFKQYALKAMESEWFARALGQSGHGGCAVLYMHRFAQDSQEPGRLDPRALRGVLAGLRKAGVEMLGLEDALGFAAGSERQTRHLAVSFTVDDGYADFEEVAWPIFKEFDCPVSLFAVPGAIVGDTWFWWDKLDWIMRNSSTSSIHLRVGGEHFSSTWSGELERYRTFEKACQWLKRWSSRSLTEAIGGYSLSHGIVVPSKAPEQFRVLGWTDLQRMEREGLRVGAHTMTHPVLSRCDDTQVRWEIMESVRLMRECMAEPLPVFCYPNGQPADHGAREWRVVEEAGIPFAMTTSGGLLRPSLRSDHDASWRYQLPRIGFQMRVGQILREFLT